VMIPDTAARSRAKTSMSSTARRGAQVLLVARDVAFHFALLSRSDVAGTLCHKEGKSLLKTEDSVFTQSILTVKLGSFVRRACLTDSYVPTVFQALP